jgi:hypothetical protein
LSFQIGDQIGDYQVIGVLGAGGRIEFDPYDIGTDAPDRNFYVALCV